MKRQLQTVNVNQTDMDYYLYGMRGYIITEDPEAQEGVIKIVTSAGNKYIANCIDCIRLYTPLGKEVSILSCREVFNG